VLAVRVVGFALCLFIAAFAVHWLLWRVWIPRRQIVWLLGIFLGVLTVGLAGAAWLPGMQGLAPDGLWEMLHVILFHVAVSLGYIVTYSALEEDSPTLTLVAFVAEGGERGRSREDVYGLLDNDFITGSRFLALLQGNLVERVGDTYVLTPRGRFWVQVFHLFRIVYHMPRGEGGS
jgi:hypothetical protein